MFLRCLSVLASALLVQSEGLVLPEVLSTSCQVVVSSKLTPVRNRATIFLALDFLTTYLNTLRSYFVTLAPITATIALTLA
jgi:hypothetical protein